eukprot:TRINITY_DN2417_c0_g1_i1.p1 TRINITY_DN2417_c0_g1~~TRINITY_DN2417_c0_g1_i1.p1  ORF type:complete len:413 (-),score=87.40 TRINITY_DN2417_c0_g1_i1:67-1305(-)
MHRPSSCISNHVLGARKRINQPQYTTTPIMEHHDPPDLEGRERKRSCNEADRPTNHVMKVENLLSSEMEPLSNPLQLPEIQFKIENLGSSKDEIPTEMETSPRDEPMQEVRPPFLFDPGSARHLELTNLNQIRAEVFDQDIESVKIQECSVINNTRPTIRMQVLAIKCPSLVYLEISALPQLLSFDDEALHLPHVRFVRLVAMKRFNGVGLGQLLRAAPQLQTIYLSDLESLADLFIPSACTKLEQIEVSDCKSIEVVRIFNTSLKSLILKDGRGITEMQFNPSAFAHLSQFVLHGCPKLDPGIFAKLHMPILAHFEMASNAPSSKGYMQVQEEALQTFIETNCHSLTHVALIKIIGVSLYNVLTLITQSRRTLQHLVLDLTCIEKPRIRDATKECPLLKDPKVEKWYIKKK